MPLRKNNTGTFHRTLYGGQLEKITLLKRGDDQRQGTVTSLVIYQCRRSRIHKTSEPIQADMTASHRTTWHIPRVELTRVGVNYLNSLDRIVDGENRYWQPEATTMISVNLFENHYDVDCVRVDPPRST